jgi:hypothetical protein
MPYQENSVPRAMNAPDAVSFSGKLETMWVCFASFCWLWGWIAGHLGRTNMTLLWKMVQFLLRRWGILRSRQMKFSLSIVTSKPHISSYCLRKAVWPIVAWFFCFIYDWWYLPCECKASDKMFSKQLGTMKVGSHRCTFGRMKIMVVLFHAS